MPGGRGQDVSYVSQLVAGHHLQEHAGQVQPNANIAAQCQAATAARSAIRDDLSTRRCDHARSRSTGYNSTDVLLLLYTAMSLRQVLGKLRKLLVHANLLSMCSVPVKRRCAFTKQLTTPEQGNAAAGMMQLDVPFLATRLLPSMT